MDRWGHFASEGGAIHRDWRSPHLGTLSPLGLGRGEMASKKTKQDDGAESSFSRAMQRQRDKRALARKAQMNSVRITEFGTALPGEEEKELIPELPEASRTSEEQ